MLPNFIVAGAPKAGTTSLYHYLKEHPQIFMPSVKEPNFFGENNYCYSLEDYKNLYSGVVNEKAIGEASPIYFASKKAPYTIKKLIPECKIIIVLRNPVERLFSAFIFSKLSGFNKGSFEKFLLAGSKSYGQWYNLANMINEGLYYEHAKRYIDIFGTKRVKINTYEELTDNPLRLIESIYNFLGVDPSFVPNIKEKYNVGAEEIIPDLNWFVVKPNIIKSILKPFIPERYRKNAIKRFLGLNVKPMKKNITSRSKNFLLNLYYEDIIKLERLINRDLSNWLE